MGKYINKYDCNKKSVILITMGMSRIVNSLAESCNLVGIVECASRNTNKKHYGLMYKIFYYIYKIYKKVIFKNDALIDYARNKYIPYYYMKNSGDILLERWIKEKQVDLIVIYSMSQLLKENIFSIPKYGAINLHTAYLPKYRGPNPLFWIYYNNDSEAGVTVHYVDKGEDTGDIIYQEKCDIPSGIRSQELLDLIVGEIGIKILLKAIKDIPNSPRVKQPMLSTTSRARNIADTEHLNIVKWHEWEIERIWHFLRGTELWLNAFDQPSGFYKGQRWTILGFEKCDTKNFSISKIYKEKHKTFIACKDGKIFLTVKFDFKKAVLNLIG